MRKRRLRGSDDATPPSGAPGWMMTYGDLVTQILAFFVLLYSFSSVNEAKFREMLLSLQNSFGFLPDAGTQETGAGPLPAEGAPGTGRATPMLDASLYGVQKRIADALKERDAAQYVRFEGKDKALIIHFDATALFDSGRAEIRRQAMPALDAVGSVLAEIKNELRIEGHTDSDPMIPNPVYPDNWALSGARAASVLRYLREFHQVPEERMSISGYADIRPVASNQTPEGKARNRRVDIVVIGR